MGPVIVFKEQLWVQVVASSGRGGLRWRCLQHLVSAFQVSCVGADVSRAELFSKHESVGL